MRLKFLLRENAENSVSCPAEECAGTGFMIARYFARVTYPLRLQYDESRET
ncbi:hypothetical protein [Paenibacillus alvei]|uniref:Uncharacterized protein n=1 Tax=Paenibacillus alvei TaxID=44250 RepID=A0AAP7A337_PAEAL|nr:hypothetical protein [Paenibacillus alvei]MCY9578042.1 hypothetical protein [Paenibacillus alvei]MCY9585336.1 hypothetical protein [Paenibacillus alvei]NOJ71957.1 hypothetical protein [Paenibacillus alvei]